MDRHPDPSARPAFSPAPDADPVAGAAGALPPRPRPVEPVHERVMRWIAWFGLPRLIVTGLCAVAMAAAGYWLVRTPAAATEATLPLAVSSSVPADTLPVPTAVPAPSTPGVVGPAAPAAEIVVHVAGEVRSPGVYVLSDGARVHDAIDRAGGPSAGADLDGLNLAAALADGQRLYVPAIGDLEPGEHLPLIPAGGADAGPVGGEPDGPVDLNRAGASELDLLPGVGPATAQAIVDDRERNGPFATVDDLERVPGIGPTKLDALRDLVRV